MVSSKRFMHDVFGQFASIQEMKDKEKCLVITGT